jgi:hypothetical protein
VLLEDLMFKQREEKIKKTWVSFFRILLAVTLMQSWFAGTLLSQAAPPAQADTVTGFDLLQSVDQSTWTAVPGDLDNGFSMALDPTVTYHYLNVANLIADPKLQAGYHPFIVSTTPPGWFSYWASNGVVSGASSGPVWWMWQIINGEQPIFYLKVTETDDVQSYMLVDGYKKDFEGVEDYLRVNGNYLLGDYTFTGTITDTTGTPSQLPVDITFFLIQHLLTVNKTGKGTVTSDPLGIDCGVTCSHDFDQGSVVTLTATADTGYTFAGWSGASCSGIGKCVVTMDAAETVAADFTLNQYTLTVAKDGTGTGTVTSNPSGIACGVTCADDFDYGTIITLTAVADGSSVFRGWSGAGCSGTGECVLTISVTDTVTATFNSQYLLTVEKAGTGSGTVTSQPAGIDCGVTCASNFDQSTVVTLTAAAAIGSTFAGWTGTACSGTGKCVLTISAADTVTANFTLNQYKLSVAKTGSGTVASNPAGIDCGDTCDFDYDYNTVVTLTATPAEGWGFFGWEGDLSGSANPIAITMDGNKSVTAVFKQYSVFLPVVRLDPVFSDDFNYADPNQVWAKWEQIAEASATWFIEANEFHGKHIVTDRNAKAVAKVYAPQMPGSYSVEAKVKLASGSVDGARCGLVFDFLDNTHTYRFVIMPGLTSGDNWLVQKRNPTLGKWDTLSGGSGRATMFSRAEYNLLRVVRQGASIKVYLNDMVTPLWSGSDSTFVNGRGGLNIGTPVGLVAGTYVEVIFDDFMVDSLN